MDKKLNEAVAALRPQMVAALQRLVRRRSVEADPLPGKPFGEEVDACFAEALALCHELGFETTDMDRYIGWCEIGTGDEMVAVLGHLDVVPEGEGWHHPPYAAEIEGGRLYGRGSIDDKGPVVASLFALKAIRELGIPLNRRVRLLFGLNEETNDRDVLYYKAHGGEIPVLGFTPDGEYPLINGEKGILNESYAVQLHQTGAWQLNRVQGGVAGNVVPDYACAALTAPAGAALPDAEHITVTASPAAIRWKRWAFRPTAATRSRAKTPSGGWCATSTGCRWRGMQNRPCTFWLRSWAPTPTASACWATGWRMRSPAP